MVIVGHPLDLIKVKMQTGGQFKGVADAAAQTIRKEGVSKGLSKILSEMDLTSKLAKLFFQHFFFIQVKRGPRMCSMTDPGVCTDALTVQ